MINYHTVDFDTLTLGQKQRIFPLMLADLVTYAYSLGYELAEGDSFRDPRVHGEMGVKIGYGHKNSCHKLKLAKDYLLWIDGIYQKTTEAYAKLGAYWKAMNSACCWGGDFADGNHFSITHEGRM